MAKVFISGSMAIPESTKLVIEQKIREIGHAPWFFRKSNRIYNEDAIKYCDVLVLITENNCFKDINIKNLPSGVQKEIEIVRERNIPILLAYKISGTKDGYMFYDIKISNNIINAISGTRNKLLNKLQKSRNINIDDELKKNIRYCITY